MSSGVYKITNSVNGKIYIGSSSNIQRRFDEHKAALRRGEHHSYKMQNDFNNQGKYIKDFDFEILELTENRKPVLYDVEQYYIDKYDAYETGYNCCPLSMNPKYTLHMQYKKHLSNEEYFTRIPNKYIKCNIQTEYEITRFFYIVFILIDRNRSRCNESIITLKDITNFCGLKMTKNKPKAVDDVKDCLRYMVFNKMISIENDLDKIRYDVAIHINIIPDNFDINENFTKLTFKEFEWIANMGSKPNRENVLLTYLYVKSFIIPRDKNEDGSELQNPQKYPEAFFKTIKSMSEDLAMSNKTITDCLNYLIQPIDDRPALLIKEEVGYIPQNMDKPPINAPNIYVLNKSGYELEIKWALEKMLEVYGVDNFIKIEN